MKQFFGTRTLLLLSLAAIAVVDFSSCKKHDIVCQCISYYPEARRHYLLEKNISWNDATKKCLDIQDRTKIKYDTCITTEIK